MPDLLLELFSEEIPARMQARAAEDLRRLMTEGLVAAGLTYRAAGAFATPRRLALHVEGLDAASRPLREERKGPAVGAPQAALDGFLRSTGLGPDRLERRPAGRGEAWFAVIERPGRPAAEIVAEVLGSTLRGFPWPKSMRWGAGSLRWVRPLRSILCLLTDEAGAAVVPFEIDGLRAGAVTQGHRIHSTGEISVQSFEDYEAKLKRAKVLLRSEERRAAIRAGAEALAFAAGMELVPDEGLLEEVAGLVEWPVPLAGPIEARFLHLPPEVLQTSMREHQKFFALRNPRSGRIERFVTVANLETPDAGAAILAGNARVLAARLSDAAFFWERDLAEARAGMAAWRAGLERVTFHNRLGSQGDRIARIAALARSLAPMVGADPGLAAQAAEVAKLDLRSAMVGEFPELQGRMGRHYARAAGLPEAVAAAVEEHYSPLGPSDRVPSAPVSVAVALADRIDLLTGFWVIDEKPTGSRDPFALRRAALGLIRLILANGLRLPLDRLADAQVLRHRIGPAPEQEGLLARILAAAAAEGLDSPATRALLAEAAAADDAPAWLAHVAGHDPAVRDSLRDFLHDRLKVHLREEGIPHDVIDACLAMDGTGDLLLLVARARALAAFRATEDGENLVQGFRRAANILAQAEAADGVDHAVGADPERAETAEERALFAALDARGPAIRAALAAEDFAAAMAGLAALRAPIDAFFEAVQVNAEDPVIRRNRLSLLARIRSLCLSVADLARLSG